MLHVQCCAALVCPHAQHVVRNVHTDALIYNVYTTVASCTVLLSAIHAVQRCPQDQLLELIHQGGLITLLKGCMVEPRSGNPHNPYNNPDGPADAIDTLTELWTRKAAEVSRELYKRIEGGCTDVWCLFL